MAHLTLVPAYGRDYKSKASLMADWNADKDFRAVGFGQSGYINRSQWLDMPAASIEFRYDKTRKVFILNSH